VSGAVPLDLSLVWPAFAAGLLVTATHVPLGIQVLRRGIVFIDLAVAQIAALGVVFAHWLGYEPQGWQGQAWALTAGVGGALLLNLTDRLWPEVQEAVIGVSFVVASNAAILLLAADPRGAEHLKDLLIGQILWMNPSLLPLVALVYGVILAAWLRYGERIGGVGFYLLFACAVTISVQLVGLYLVFTTLIVPALATRGLGGRRLGIGYGLGALGYAAGLALSLVSDFPPGPLIVCLMTGLGALLFIVNPAPKSTL
jgi:zinc/manganese transport system permease protein